MQDTIKISDFETSDKYGVSPEKRDILSYLAHGIINLDKPRGPDSHQVVYWIKKILNVKKAGQVSTLDPFASGVLPVALNRATKALSIVKYFSKRYVGIMHLHTNVNPEKIDRVCKRFIGEIYVCRKS